MAYIDKELLKRNIRVNLMPNVDIDGTVTVENAERYFLNLIDKTSTADVEEVKHGEWKHSMEVGQTYNYHYWNCSLCGASAFTSGYEKYCHECGAKMDGKDINVPTRDGGKAE